MNDALLFYEDAFAVWKTWVIKAYSKETVWRSE